MTPDPILEKLARRVRAVQAAQRAALDSGKGGRRMDPTLLAVSLELETALDADCKRFLERTPAGPAAELAHRFRCTLASQRAVWRGYASADQRRECRDNEHRLAAAVKAILDPPTPGLFDAAE